jgi:hypothetical protein
LRFHISLAGYGIILAGIRFFFNSKERCDDRADNTSNEEFEKKVTKKRAART